MRDRQAGGEVNILKPSIKKFEKKRPFSRLAQKSQRTLHDYFLRGLTFLADSVDLRFVFLLAGFPMYRRVKRWEVGL